MRRTASLVEGEIDRIFPKDLNPQVLAEASRHLIEAGGKRLRPYLVLMTCEAVGGKAEDALNRKF